MRNGFKVFDADTHLQPPPRPSSPTWTGRLRERVGDLDSFRVPIKVGSAGQIRQEPYRHYWRFSRGEGWARQAPLPRRGQPRPNEERRHQRFMGTKPPLKAASTTLASACAIWTRRAWTLT